MTKTTEADKTPDPKPPANLAMWDRLMPTDPKYTKAFDRGGFKGTATNATYIVRKLTEEFGPCGQGWVFVLDEERVREGHTLKNGDKAQLHIVRGHIRYNIGGTYWDTSPQFGQTMLVGENKYGTFTDEEAPKKSITDCISKCAVLLGIAADVHLGLFDDNKYVNTRKAEEAAAATVTMDKTKPITVTNDSPIDQTINGNVVKPGETVVVAAAPQQGSTDDMTIARQVFSLVKGTAEKATDVADINDCMKHNKASLAVLERASPTNYEVLKGIVTEARKRLTPIDPALDDELPDFV